MMSEPTDETMAQRRRWLMGQAAAKAKIAEKQCLDLLAQLREPRTGEKPGLSLASLGLAFGAKCQFPECTDPATQLARGYDKFPQVGAYCADHAGQVAKDGHPEYEVECPNCHCLFGVG